MAEDVSQEELDPRLCRRELSGLQDTDFRPQEMEGTSEALSSLLSPGNQDRQAPSEQPHRTPLSLWLPSSLRAGGERLGTP